MIYQNILITNLEDGVTTFMMTLDLGPFSNKWIIVGIIAMVALQLFYTYHPSMNFTFHSSPISIEAWLRILAISVTLYFIIEAYKKIRKSKYLFQKI